MSDNKKLVAAIDALSHALSFEEKSAKDSFYYLGIAKAFEVALEYCWKYFQREAMEAGFEIVSPRDAIKQAGVLGLVDDVEKWLSFLRVRNVAVHDYLGVSPEDHLRMIKEFYAMTKKLDLK